MSGQPLSHKKFDDMDFFNLRGPADVDQELRATVSYIIATWAEINVTITRAVSRMIERDFKFLTGLLQGINSERLRADLVETIAEATLSKEDLKLFTRVMRDVWPIETMRNLYAHSIWRVSPTLPKALILVDPLHFAVLEAEDVQKQRRREELAARKERPREDELWTLATEGWLVIDREKATVVEFADAKRDARDAANAYVAIWTFGNIRFPGPGSGGGDAARRELRLLLHLDQGAS